MKLIYHHNDVYVDDDDNGDDGDGDDNYESFELPMKLTDPGSTSRQ